MQDEIFDSADWRTDSNWIVKEFFNSMYSQGRFMWALPLILERKGCAVNEDYCFFPDKNDPNPEYHFEGVKIGLMDDEVTLDYDELLTFIGLACNVYVKLHPEDKQKVDDLIAGVR